MRIIQVIRLPDGAVCYWQKVVWWLTEELVRRGHEVSLVTSESFAHRRTSGGEESKPSRSGTYTTGPLAGCATSASEFDIVHLHCERPEEVPSAQFRAPVIATVHDAEEGGETPAHPVGVSHPLVSVFGRQEHWLTKYPNWWGNIPYGAPRQRFQLSESLGYLLVDGSLSSEAGVAEALCIARRSRLPLRVVMREPNDGERLRHNLGGDSSVRVFEGLSEDERLTLLAGASGLIIPPTSHPGESFLSAIEALAFGTPTITRAGGVLDHVIVNGVTGFLCETLEHAAMLTAHVDQLHRPACRAHFERVYTVEQKVDRYEAMYARFLRSGTEASRAG